jgi:deazaflavin-dependent oxidoreductase (nitroreductase family)
MPNIRWLIRLITRLHRFVYLVTDGRIGGGTLGREFILLHHVGRKSGRAFTTPLLCIEIEEGFAVMASNAGDPRFPSWWLNLEQDPVTRVQHRRRKLRVRARKALGEEREALWGRLMRAYPFFDRYEARAGREIPVVVLSAQPESRGYIEA